MPASHLRRQGSNYRTSPMDWQYLVVWCFWDQCFYYNFASCLPNNWCLEAQTKSLWAIVVDDALVGDMVPVSHSHLNSLMQKFRKILLYPCCFFHSKSFAQKPPDLVCKGLNAAFKPKKLVLPLNPSLSRSQCPKENSVTFGNHNLISHRGSLSHDFKQSTTNTSKPHNVIPHNSSVTLMERHSHCCTTLQHFVSPPDLFSSAA